MTLQAAIAKIQDIAGAVSGIRAAPEYPPDSINIFPTLVCFASSGSFEYAPAGIMKGLHNITLELYVSRKDLPRDAEKLMPYADSIPLALMADPTLGGTVSTFGRITYESFSAEFGNLKTIGFRFTLEGVKLQTTI